MHLTAAAVTINWATILPLFVQLLYILIPLIALWVGVAAKRFLDAHTSGTTQEVLEKITATVVQGVEQTYAGQQSTPETQRAKFDAASTALARNVFDQLHLTLSDTQIKSLIESGVHALNAGAIALVPGSAALLPADLSATTQTNLDQFKQDVVDTVTQSVPGVVQSTLASMLGAAVTQVPAAAQQAAQPTIGQVSSAQKPDVVVQPGVSVGLAGQPTATQSTPLAQQ